MLAVALTPTRALCIARRVIRWKTGLSGAVATGAGLTHIWLPHHLSSSYPLNKYLSPCLTGCPGVFVSPQAGPWAPCSTLPFTRPSSFLIHLLVEEAEISPLQVGKLRLRSEIMCPAPTMPPPAVGLTSHPGAQGRGPRTSAWRGSQPLQPRTLLAPCPFLPLLVFLSETWWGVTLSLLY